MSLSRRTFAAGLFTALASAAAVPALAAPGSDALLRHPSPCPPGVDPRVALCRSPDHHPGDRHPGQHARRGPWQEDWRWRQPRHPRMHPPMHPQGPHWPPHHRWPGAPNGNPGPFPPMRAF